MYMYINKTVHRWYDYKENPDDSAGGFLELKGGLSRVMVTGSV